MPFGENNRHVTVRLIDFDNLSNNTYIATNQYRIHHRETKIPDIVLMINGIPVNQPISNTALTILLIPSSNLALGHARFSLI